MLLANKEVLHWVSPLKGRSKIRNQYIDDSSKVEENQALLNIVNCSGGSHVPVCVELLDGIVVEGAIIRKVTDEKHFG